MNKIKIGINGFGRIGRLVFRAAEKNKNIEVVGINDLIDAEYMSYMLRYDSTHGKFKGSVETKGNDLIVNGNKIRITNEKNSKSIGNFLIENNDLRHVVRRAFIIEKFPYSEIQDNIIGSKLIPIDMLRLKLSFFGALKFDPRSDKWLRITMFQGAPLPNELKNFNDQWIYNSLN